MIRFEQVTRRYEADGRPALDDVTVEFYREDFAFLIGASGSGKSTLLRMILREGLPQRGKVTVAGQNLGLMLDRRVPDFRRSIGMVFQDFRLLPDKTVFDNVAFAMRVLGAKRSLIRRRVTKVLEKVDLAHLAKRYPHEISGGEQQRAAIARAIVNDPAILLADEPTGNLDPRASAEVMKVLRWINASGTTVIMATHDRAIVDQANSRVVQLHHGRVVRDERHGSYDPAEGSEAWDVLAKEESESGLRAHDPAPLKAGIAPALVEPDAQDHDFVESRDDAIDHVGDHPQDQVMAPGEDPSVLAYDEDPVLRETVPFDSTEELAELDLDDDAFTHEASHAAEPLSEDHDHGLQDAPTEDEPLGHAPFEHEHEHEHEPQPDFAGQDAAPQQDAGLRVTWPEHLRDDAPGHDVPEPHGDFNGTEMPDLEQDGYTEAEDGAVGSFDESGDHPADGTASNEPDQTQPASTPVFDGDPLAPLTPAPEEQARPRLSWLAHTEDEIPQSFSAQPRAEEPDQPPELRSEPELLPEPAPATGSEPVPEREESTPLPQPKTSTDHSDHSDHAGAAVTGEHLGSSRPRRSIMRVLRRKR